jgi:hypothetical protein
MMDLHSYLLASGLIGFVVDGRSHIVCNTVIGNCDIWDMGSRTTECVEQLSTTVNEGFVTSYKPSKEEDASQDDCRPRSSGSR